MRILHIATQAPGHTSGGEIGTLLFSYALNNIGAKVDYIGPEIKDKTIAAWYNKITYLEKPINRIEKAWTLMHFYFDRHYLGWKRENVNFNQYQVIFVEFTKMDYFIRDILKAGYKGKIIVRAHNVEHDFFRINYMAHKTIMNGMKYLISKKRENYMIKNSDLVLAITELDKKRLIELYGISPDKVQIFPVAVNLAEENKTFSGAIGSKLKCLITGSLWFGPNADATVWFLKEVYPVVKNICDLTVAGFKPNEQVKQCCQEGGVRLVDSPDDMEPYFRETEMVLAPIFDGGGMKVKIAEALSYALPVVTTDHGNIGYDLVDRENGLIANTAQDFISDIQFYYGLSNEARSEILQNSWRTYTEKFSLNAAVKRCDRIVKELVQ